MHTGDYTALCKTVQYTDTRQRITQGIWLQQDLACIHMSGLADGMARTCIAATAKYLSVCRLLGRQALVKHISIGIWTAGLIASCLHSSKEVSTHSLLPEVIDVYQL